MIVTITLTSAGNDTGPLFDLYSDVDNFVTPFETNVSKTSLLSGYTSSLVPEGTTQIKVQSLGTCTNSITLTIQSLPEQCYITVTSLILVFNYSGGTLVATVDTNDTYTIVDYPVWTTCSITDDGVSILASSYYGLTPRSGTITIRGCNDSIERTINVQQIGYNAALSLTVNINYYEDGNNPTSGLGGSYYMEFPNGAPPQTVSIAKYSKTHTTTFNNGSGRYFLGLTIFHYTNDIIDFTNLRHRINGGEWINGALLYVDVSTEDIVLDIDVSSTPFSEVDTYTVNWTFTKESTCSDCEFYVFVGGSELFSKNDVDFQHNTSIHGEFTVNDGDLVELKVYNGSCMFGSAVVGDTINEISDSGSWVFTSKYITGPTIIVGVVDDDVPCPETYYLHYSSTNSYSTPSEACDDVGDNDPYYINDSEPSVGSRVYNDQDCNVASGTLGYWIPMHIDGGTRFAVKINSIGYITDTYECS